VVFSISKLGGSLVISISKLGDSLVFSISKLGGGLISLVSKLGGDVVTRVTMFHITIAYICLNISRKYVVSLVSKPRDSLIS